MCTAVSGWLSKNCDENPRMRGIFNSKSPPRACADSRRDNQPENCYRLMYPLPERQQFKKQFEKKKNNKNNKKKPLPQGCLSLMVKIQQPDNTKMQLPDNFDPSMLGDGELLLPSPTCVLILISSLLVVSPPTGTHTAVYNQHTK